jgi:hypothetical protein
MNAGILPGHPSLSGDGRTAAEPGPH